MRKQVRITVIALLVLFAPVALFAAGGSEPEAEVGPAEAVIEEDFDLDELIAAAQAEGEVTVYDTSSRVLPGTWGTG